MDAVYRPQCARDGCVSAVANDGPVAIDVEVGDVILHVLVALCPVHADEVVAREPVPA